MRTLVVLLCLAATACGGSGMDQEFGSEGGAAGAPMGGASASGGSSSGSSSGGSMPVTSGGASSSSGGSSSGGSPTSGGATTTTSSGGEAATTGGMASGGAAGGASQGGSSSGGAVTSGGSKATGGAAGTAGAGGAVDPLAPYPAPDCPGFMAVRSAGLGTCVGLRGRFEVRSPGAQSCNVANPTIETCGSVTDTGQFKDGAPMIYFKDVATTTAAIKVLRANVDSSGNCPYACEAP